LFAVEERTGHDGASVCFLWWNFTKFLPEKYNFDLCKGFFKEKMD
jgi:hypothetical protein